MATIPCPSCGRKLNLPEGLRGSTVQCPSCQTSFTAPPETPPTHFPSPVVQWSQPETAAPDPAPRASEPFEFDEENSALKYLDRRRVEDAATWLRRGVTCDLASSLMCCLCSGGLGGFDGPKGQGIFETALFVSVVQFLLELLVYIGASYLVRRRARGMCRLAVLASSLLALRAVGQLLFLVTVVGNRAFRLDLCYLIYVLIVLGLTVTAVISFAVGASKTATALGDPEVTRHFR